MYLVWYPAVPSQIELVVIDWVRNWLGYPETSGGLLTSGSSAGSVEAFVAARESAGHPERATVYMSDQSHYALVRAAMVVVCSARMYSKNPKRRKLLLGHGSTCECSSRRSRGRFQSHFDRSQCRDNGHWGCRPA